MTYTFNHNEKLKSKKLIELLFKEGKAFHSFPYRVVYLQNSTGIKLPESKTFVSGFPIKFGVSVGTKNFGKAVDRNRVKRLTREAWRLHKHHCYEKAISADIQLAIFFIYTQKEILSFAEVEKGILNAIKKLNEMIEKGLPTPIT
jgi:ribonuclease P protein component